jgi:hypothetical protein
MEGRGKRICELDLLSVLFCIYLRAKKTLVLKFDRLSRLTSMQYCYFFSGHFVVWFIVVLFILMKNIIFMFHCFNHRVVIIMDYYGLGVQNGIMICKTYV